MKRQAPVSTLSELLVAAIADARRLDRSQYEPCYRNWHLPNGHGTCEVCLGGSYMAATLGCSPTVQSNPWNYPGRTQAMMEALNAMRLGAWAEAYRILFQREPSDKATLLMARMAIPSCRDFLGWREFDTHLLSLESFLPLLREIETEEHSTETLKG